MTSEKKYYVYVHRKATDGTVFYVGKGCGRRYLIVAKRSNYWNRLVNKYGFTAQIVMRFNNEKCAFSFECALIKFYGRENLCNMTQGGEGLSGYNVTEETKEKISASLSGCNHRLWGKKQTQEMKDKVSKAISGNKNHMFGKKHTDATKEKISVSRSGIPTSNETRVKLSIAGKVRIFSLDTRLKMSLCRIGIKLSDTTRQKISDVQVKKPVVCGNGMIFDSVTSASFWVKNNVNPKATTGNISSCAIGDRNKAYGYTWKYV